MWRDKDKLELEIKQEIRIMGVGGVQMFDACFSGEQREELHFHVHRALFLTGVGSCLNIDEQSLCTIMIIVFPPLYSFSPMQH